MPFCQEMVENVLYVAQHTVCEGFRMLQQLFSTAVPSRFLLMASSMQHITIWSPQCHSTSRKVSLTSLNHGLVCRVALVSELSEENAKLAEENRQINVSIRKVLEDNAELTNRLIEIALRNEEGGDAIFGSDGRSPKAAGGAANTLLSTSQEDMRKRRNELAEQVTNLSCP